VYASNIEEHHMKIVSYIRVSTTKQGESGLGLEAQRSAVARFQADHTVVAEFIEIEHATGKKHRPQMAAAIALCKQTGATLVVAKLDRLARNVHFTSSLMESGVEFIACDMPHANRLTIHIMAAMAEDEARRISTRTKDALAELKAKGVKLGSARPGHWDGIEHRRGWRGMQGTKKQAVLAERFRATYAAVLPLIETLVERGESVEKITTTLNNRGLKTSKGATWRPTSVRRVVERLQSSQELVA
jgi:DNA invertase Pin-like site-specific DNA recombinase